MPPPTTRVSTVAQPFCTQVPEKYPVETLSFLFGVSQSAVKRILKSQWKPSRVALARQAVQSNRREVFGVLDRSGGQLSQGPGQHAITEQHNAIPNTGTKAVASNRRGDVKPFRGTAAKLKVLPSRPEAKAMPLAGKVRPMVHCGRVDAQRRVVV